MADLVRTGYPSLASPEPPACFLPVYTAGADCYAGDLLAIRADGNAYPMTPSDTVPAGFCLKSTNAGFPVTPAMHQRLYYTYTATPVVGGALYVSTGTPGGLATTAPSSGWANPVAWQCAVDRIQSKV